MPPNDRILFLEEGEVEAVETVDGSTDVLVLTIIEELATVQVGVPEGLLLIDAGPAVAGGGSAVSTYTHTQSTPAATWIIDHNLGQPREPVVLLDSNPTKQVWTDVEHGTYNQTTLTFPSPVSGKAIF